MNISSGCFSSAKSDSESNNRICIELFVKAAADKLRIGGCPICQRYFMAFYILREQGAIDLIVTTAVPENPPKEVLQFSTGRHYPLVKVHSGVDKNGKDVKGIECETVNEIEELLDRIETQPMYVQNGMTSTITNVVDLYMKLSHFLKMPVGDSASLIKCLEKLDSHLCQQRTEFLLGNKLTRADCYLIPTLQHIRVAGKAYKSFEIPTEFFFIWQYLRHVYESSAMRSCCPSDAEIINQYRGISRSTSHKKPPMSTPWCSEDRTFSIPKELFKNSFI